MKKTTDYREVIDRYAGIFQVCEVKFTGRFKHKSIYTVLEGFDTLEEAKEYFLKKVNRGKKKYVLTKWESSFNQFGGYYKSVINNIEASDIYYKLTAE